MKYIICIKKENYRYSTSESHDIGLKTLIFFLRDGGKYDWFKTWANDSNEGDQTGSNDCILTKKNNNIEISLDPNIFDTIDPITVTKQNFIIILNQWKKLCKEKWDQIIITQDDNGEVHLEGKNE